MKSIINQYDSIEDAIKERVQSYIAELKITQTESNIMQQEMEKIEREEYAKQLIAPSLMGNIEQQIEENQKEKVNKNIIDCQNEILQNPFNQSGNSDYLYTSAGIRGIIKLMNLHSKNYSYHDVPLNSDYVSVEEFSEFIKKDVLIVYNIENSHWISVASIVNNQTNLVVLIKNSLGYSRFEGLESKFNALKPMNFSIEFKYNRA